MFYMEIILSLIAVGGVCFAGCLLHTLRVTRQRTDLLTQAAVDDDARINALERELAEATESGRAARAQIDGLLVRLARLEKAAAKPEYAEAMSLSRRGADTHELKSTCGLNLGEARLIKTLYGSHADAADESPNRNM